MSRGGIEGRWRRSGPTIEVGGGGGKGRYVDLIWSTGKLEAVIIDADVDIER